LPKDFKKNKKIRIKNWNKETAATEEVKTVCVCEIYPEILLSEGYSKRTRLKVMIDNVKLIESSC
jgi:hypothetical protein